MPEIKKIALGTAQFGMDYGINNKRGRIPKEEAVAILNRAIKAGIDTVDTASTYGDSEKVLGDFVKSSGDKLKIVSKLPICEYREVKDIVNSSLRNIGVSKLYGYLVHNFENYKKDRKIWEELENRREESKIEKIGFSLYFPNELVSILEENLKVDILQLPLNIFDQRFDTYLKDLKSRGIEIHARSVFLQGLVFKKTTELNENFKNIKDKIEQLDLLSKRHKIPIFALCLNFVILHPNINKVVIGVDSLEHLERNLDALASAEAVRKIYRNLLNLKETNEDIIVPMRWSAYK